MIEMKLMNTEPTIEIKALILLKYIPIIIYKDKMKILIKLLFQNVLFCMFNLS